MSRSAGPVRIWHQSMTELAGLNGYRRRLAAHAQSLFGPAVQVDVHGVQPDSYGGLTPTEMLKDPYVHHLVGRQVPTAARAAERDGYDAFVIGSFSEPYLRETRSAVDIPVVSLNESALLLGASFGPRMAFVANAEAVADLVRASIERHRLGDRVSVVRALDPSLTEPELLDDDPTHVLAAFTAIAAELVDAGADVVVPAEGVLCEVLHDCGLTEIAGVPVLDSIGLTWRHALLMCDLWRDGLRPSRRRAYPRAPDDVVVRIEDAVGS